MQKLGRLLASFLFLFLFIPIFNPSFAEYTAGCNNDFGANTVWTLNCVFPLVANLIGLFLGLAGTIAVIMIIYAGIKFMFSGGDAKQIESTRNILLYAILGLVLIFSAFGIISFIAYVTNVACINPTNLITGNPFEVCK
jgi:hypothetical protein